RAAGDTRTLAQIRADLLVARVSGIEPLTGALAVEVNLVMTDTALFGGASTAARLAGYGPIPAELARDLARTGSMRPDPDADSRCPTTAADPDASARTDAGARPGASASPGA